MLHCGAGPTGVFGVFGVFGVYSGHCWPELIGILFSNIFWLIFVAKKDKKIFYVPVVHF